MDDPAEKWIEFTTQDGRSSRLRVDQMGMVTRVNGGDAGVIHTSLGELIRVLNVTHVLRQWRHPPPFVVSRRAANYHSHLERAVSRVDRARGIFYRRGGGRRPQQ